MTDIDTATAMAQPRQSRVRTAAMWTLLTLAGLLLLLSTIAVWVDRVALNTQVFTDKSSELLADGAIRSAVATRAVDELYAAVDVQTEIEDQLPKDLKSLSGIAAAGIRQGAYQVVDRALEQPTLQRAFALAVEQAHGTFVDILEGGGDKASTEGGEVTLDLRAIVLDTADRIGIGAQIVDKIPADAGRIVVFRSDQLKTAQSGFHVLKTLAWFLPLLTLAALGGAVWVARDRRRAIRGFGIVSIVVGVLGILAARMGGSYIVGSLVSDRETRAAANNAWMILSEVMRGSFRWLILLGILIVVGSWLLGAGRRTATVRSWLAPVLRERAWAYAALALFALALLLASSHVGFARLLWIVLVVVLGALWIEAMRAQALKENPDASMPAFVDETRDRIASWWSERRAAAAARPAALATSTTISTPPGDVSAQLASLASLHEQGHLTDEEFSSAKARVLAGG